MVIFNCETGTRFIVWKSYKNYRKGPEFLKNIKWFHTTGEYEDDISTICGVFAVVIKKIV